jgi:hypothetical protein
MQIAVRLLTVFKSGLLFHLILFHRIHRFLVFNRLSIGKMLISLNPFTFYLFKKVYLKGINDVKKILPKRKTDPLSEYHVVVL